MLLWRLYREAHGPGLDGVGGLFAPGRWHEIGTPVVYFGASPAIVVLEKLAHIDAAVLPDDLILTRFEGELSVAEVMQHEVSDIHDLTQTQARGRKFLENKEACVLRVPSVIVKGEYNYLFNPLHADAAKLKAYEHLQFTFEPRIL